MVSIICYACFTISKPLKTLEKKPTLKGKPLSFLNALKQAISQTRPHFSHGNQQLDSDLQIINRHPLKTYILYNIQISFADRLQSIRIICILLTDGSLFTVSTGNILPSVWIIWILLWIFFFLSFSYLWCRLHSHHHFCTTNPGEPAFPQSLIPLVKMLLFMRGDDWPVKIQFESKLTEI